MIESTQEYKASIVADARRMMCRAVIDIISPDLVYGTVTSSSKLIGLSNSNQLHDKETELTAKYTTLELNRFGLDGTSKILVPGKIPEGQVGFINGVVSKDDGKFSTSQYVQLNFSNVSILQALSVYFPNAETEGIPVNFTVAVRSGSTTKYSKEYVDNESDHISISGFTVNNPTNIRVTVTRWSLPGRFMRVVEIIPGIYEKWNGDMFASISVKQQCDTSCLSIPYGTATVVIDNQNRRFDPRNKAGIFQSIEERQGIPLYIGPQLPDGTVEYKKIGVFYQYAGGWKTAGNGLTIKWELADIIGLMQTKIFPVPSTLPTTLEGWVTACASAIGENFTELYQIDSEYAELPVTVLSKNDVIDYTCGDIIRNVCMVTGTFPRADAKTGVLFVGPVKNDISTTLTLDNMNNYPSISSITRISEINFTLNNGQENNTYTVKKQNVVGESKSVSNPFIHTTEQANNVAEMIFSAYTGDAIEVTGRGDPSLEVGDYNTVWLDNYGPANARLLKQNLNISNGTMKNCNSTYWGVVE